MAKRTPGAALLCYTDGTYMHCDITHWRDVAEALQALHELAPCGPDCAGDHRIVVAVDGRPRVLRPDVLQRRETTTTREGPHDD